MCQKRKESVQQFLLRIMDARNKVVFDSKEADTDFNYFLFLFYFIRFAN
jgi:hypothetical protein